MAGEKIARAHWTLALGLDLQHLQLTLSGCDEQPISVRLDERAWRDRGARGRLR